MKLTLEPEKEQMAPPKDPEEETESLREEIREQQKKLKDMTPKERASYYAYYYKWHLLIAIAVIFFIVYVVSNVLSHKDVAFYCILLNVDHPMVETTDFASDFEGYAGIDQKHYKTVFDTTISTSGKDNPLLVEDAYSSTMRLTALFMGASVDVFCCDEATLEEYALEESTLMDIRDYLDSDLFESLDSRGLIIRKKGFDGIERPVGVKVSESEKFISSGCYDKGTEVWAGLIYNGPNLDMYNVFINYLFS